jgi:hypothetical protein
VDGVTLSVKEGDHDDAIGFEAIEQGVWKPVKLSAANLVFDEGIQPRTRPDAFDAPEELFQELVSEPLSLLLVPAIGLVQLLGCRFAKVDPLHEQPGPR